MPTSPFALSIGPLTALCAAQWAVAAFGSGRRSRPVSRAAIVATQLTLTLLTIGLYLADGPQTEWLLGAGLHLDGARLFGLAALALLTTQTSPLAVAALFGSLVSGSMLAALLPLAVLTAALTGAQTAGQTAGRKAYLGWAGLALLSAGTLLAGHGPVAPTMLIQLIALGVWLLGATVWAIPLLTSNRPAALRTAALTGLLAALIFCTGPRLSAAIEGISGYLHFVALAVGVLSWSRATKDRFGAHWLWILGAALLAMQAGTIDAFEQIALLVGAAMLGFGAVSLTLCAGALLHLSLWNAVPAPHQVWVLAMGVLWALEIGRWTVARWRAGALKPNAKQIALFTTALTLGLSAIAGWRPITVDATALASRYERHRLPIDDSRGYRMIYLMTRTQPEPRSIPDAGID